MPSVMVLGPSRWADPARAGSPLEVRRLIAASLRQNGLPAVVMEDEVQGAGEPHTAFFTRLVREHDVRRFLVYWPFGARLHGLEKEAGDLLRWVHDRVLPAREVYLLVERSMTDEAGGGRLALSEPGNRTRYHEDFLAYGVRLRVWDDPEALAFHVQAFHWDATASEAPRWHDALARSRPSGSPSLSSPARP